MIEIDGLTKRYGDDFDMTAITATTEKPDQPEMLNTDIR